MSEKYETTILPGDYEKNSLPYGSLRPTTPAAVAQVPVTPAPVTQPQPVADGSTPSSSKPE